MSFEDLPAAYHYELWSGHGSSPYTYPEYEALVISAFGSVETYLELVGSVPGWRVDRLGFNFRWNDERVFVVEDMILIISPTPICASLVVGLPVDSYGIERYLSLGSEDLVPVNPGHWYTFLTEGNEAGSTTTISDSSGVLGVGTSPFFIYSITWVQAAAFRIPMTNDVVHRPLEIDNYEFRVEIYEPPDPEITEEPESVRRIFARG